MRSLVILRSRAFASYSTAAGASEEIVDVAIVGAGMVGAAVAALLRHNRLTSGMRIAVLDRQPPPMTLDMPQYPDLRVSTITPGSIEAIQNAGAWGAVAPPYSAEFSHMQVWDFAGPGHVRWCAQDIGAPRMGVVVENRILQAALLRAATAKEAPGHPVEIISPACIASLRLPQGPEASTSSTSSTSTTSSSSSNELAELALEDGRRLRCRLVVGADGGQSRIREMAGLRTMGWAYNQRGLVATVATSEPSTTAWQRFLPDGPLALLPVRGGFSNIVWTNTPEGAKRLEGMSSEQFADAANAALQDSAQQQQQAAAPLTSALSGVLGALQAGAAAVNSIAGASGMTPGGSGGSGGDDGSFRSPPLVLGYVGDRPKSFPLQLRHSGRYVLPRLALVGDAAHTVHPLAGQGVNLGLGDAAALAAALAAAREVGRDIGELSLLRNDYEAPRQRANLGMMASMDSIQRLFCRVGGGPLGAVRAAGLGAVNMTAPIKNQLMRIAMGMPLL